MNRRGFIASIPFLPTAVKAVVTSASVPQVISSGYPWAYNANAKSIQQLLEDCGKCVEPAPFDMDAFFEQLYRLKCHRENSALVSR